MAGVTLVRNERPTTAVFTEPEAPEIDRAQYETGRGPCVAAYRTGEILRIDDTLTDDRWPEFAAAAAAHGVRSTLSLPLNTEDSILGALNLYSRRVSAFDGNDQIVSVFVAHAATSLANSHAYWAAQTLSEQLQEALESRAVIEQAKGILIAEHRCDPDDAFEMLRIRSQHENRKLRDIATGPGIPLAWPISGRAFEVPYPAYAALLVAGATTAIERHRRITRTAEPVSG